MSSSAIAIRGRQQQSSYELSSSELDWHTASLVPLSCSNGQVVILHPSHIVCSPSLHAECNVLHFRAPESDVGV